MCTQDLPSKAEHLRRLVAELRSVAVAYSGGVDSTLLLAVAGEVLGPDRTLALTVHSELTPALEQQRAAETARQAGIRHRVVHFNLLGDAEVSANRADRCYHCKRALLTRLKEIALDERLDALVHGANDDDAGDYRPGLQAAEELGVRAPLLEAGFTKADVRSLSRQMGLPTWDLPSAACLASRIPYDTPLTAEALARVEAAEVILRDVFSLRQLRVRDHFPIARIEVPQGDVARLASPDARQTIIRRMEALGYRYVTLDLRGFRSGSMNEQLSSGQ
jgi:uncharacterized protein